MNIIVGYAENIRDIADAWLQFHNDKITRVCMDEIHRDALAILRECERQSEAELNDEQDEARHDS